jgi:Na+/H+ antiporter NhaD/arsenite permease-like protein
LQGLHLQLQPLWWALLFGGCFGGNITLVGSTANIVALGILEKEKNIRMTFFRWFWVGLTVGVVTTCVVWLALTILPFYK